MRSVFGNAKRLPAIVVVLLGAAIVAVLIYQAWLSPDVQFLPPAGEGSWIVDPGTFTGYREAIFIRRFDLPAAPAHYPVRIAAMREGRIDVNGQSVPSRNGKDWKRPVAYDLGPMLHAGPNEIRIRVATPDPPPALLVQGPEPIRSDERWTILMPPDSPSERAVGVAYRDEIFLSDRPNVFRASPWFRLWVGVLVAYGAFIVYALLPLRWKRWIRPPDPALDTPTWRGDVACLILFVVVAAIQVRNARVYPYKGGFDGTQHIDYVEWIAERRTVPDVKQGWEMSQPPLYYALGAGLYTLFGGAARKAVALKTVQFLSTAAALATIAVTWWMLGLLHPAGARLRVLGFAVTALMPMLFYMSPEISNESLAAFVIGAAMFVAMRQVARGDARWRDAFVVGAGCGLALLSKYTGAFVLVVVVALAGLRLVFGDGMRLRRLGWMLLMTGTALAMSGWLYVRNVEKFGTPFIGAWDRRSGFNIVQPPGYRTATFYTRFGSVFWQLPERSRDTSFWDGMYGSMWADSHNVFVRRDDRFAALSSVCLWLALLPTVAVLAGFCQALWHLTTRQWDHPYFVIVLTSVLTVTALLWFTLEHPWYSTLKAHWALSLVPCAGVFGGLGLETMCRRSGRLRWVVYANVVALGGVVLYLFWYRVV
jgi:hypothetical protein